MSSKGLFLDANNDVDLCKNEIDLCKVKFKDKSIFKNIFQL